MAKRGFNLKENKKANKQLTVELTEIKDEKQWKAAHTFLKS